MALIDDLKARLGPEEGQRLFAYHDQLGHLTIGQGFLLEGSHVRLMQQLLGLDETRAENIVRGASPITPAQSDLLLDYTATCAITDAGDVVGRDTWERLPYAAQIALADMCFQMGPGGLGAFQRMLAALRRDPPDWPAVLREMNDSEWDRETPARADGVEALIHALIHPSVTAEDRARAVALFVSARPAASAHAGDDDPPETSDA